MGNEADEQDVHPQERSGKAELGFVKVELMPGNTV